jgi:hypothetical protein
MNDRQDSDHELLTELLNVSTRLSKQPCVARICVRCRRECCCNALVQYPMHEWCEALDSWQYVD